MGNLSSTAPLILKRVVVENARMRLLVYVPAGAHTCLGPEAAARLLEARPNLAYHACVNDQGQCFAHELSAASLPHVFEHMLIDFQTAHPHSSSVTFVGTTQWVSKTDALALVEVNFEDDLVAWEAITKALALMKEVVESV